ncbi:MAG: alkaline phosphatase family protein [Labilithrix sp.]|nr:alkaline phosphatase family protein [Labilithrix sp.]
MNESLRRSFAATLLLATITACSADNAAPATSAVAPTPEATVTAPATPAPTGAPAPPAATPPRRVVFFLGDGMGINVMTAARIYAKGETGSLTMDTLPETGFVRTYSKDSQVTDSAAAMTAYMTGIKVGNDVLSMSADTKYKGTNGTAVKTLLEIAKSDKLGTGVVTTTRVTHATPAATYAHVNDRDREEDIAAQLVPGEKGYNAALGDGVDVVLGGGTRQFLPMVAASPGRADGRNLVEVMKSKGYAYADTKAGFDAIPKAATKVLGLFGPSHMSYELDRDAQKEPSLAEMSLEAVDVLAKNPRGFFLMVEGGRIDHALHETNAKRALADTVAFDRAIADVLARLRKDDPTLASTLVVVTADHDHTMVLNGYAKRTGPTSATQAGVLGLVNNYVTGVPDLDADGRPYSILGFGNGENRVGASRASVPALTPETTSANDYHQEAAIRMPVGGETHGGTDVAIMAIGKGAAAVHGIMDNTEVHAVLRGAVAAPPAPAAKAKNILFFLGDGMGPTSVTAGRIYNKGETGKLAMEKLEHAARVKTYSNDAQTTDSAPSMGAYMTGVKANNEVLAMSGDTVADKNNCTAQNGKPVPTLLELAKKAGKSVGAVTTTEATHATPAATYAHICHRDLAYDIAKQAVPGGAGYNAGLGTGLDVLLGGGANHWTPLDATTNPKGRPDGRDLFAELRTAGYSVVNDRAALAALPATATKLVGIFSATSHLSYELDRATAAPEQPSLAEMTTAALGVLERSSAGKGWFLMVEGGRIDHALHGTNAKRALHDVGAFDAAIEAALAKVDLKETLVVVTADHDHTMVINGYAKRGNSLLDVVRDRDDVVSLDADGLAYPVLAFGNGESRPDVRTALTSVDTMNADFHQLAGVRRAPGGETHGGGDVMLLATGAGSSPFHGTIENTQVFTLVKSALGL